MDGVYGKHAASLPPHAYDARPYDAPTGTPHGLVVSPPPQYGGTPSEVMAGMMREREQHGPVPHQHQGADPIALHGGLGSGASATMYHGFVPGQQVEAAKDLFARDNTGEAFRAVCLGCRGVVLGPPTSDDPHRLAVLFDDHVSEPLNVLPHEVRIGQEPFDTQSRSIEVHLARLLWEGRDPHANALPDPMDTEVDVKVLQAAASESPRRFIHQLPPEQTQRTEVGDIPIGPMSLSAVPTKSKQRIIDPVYRARLLAFFDRYNPHRLPAVPALLQEHAGQEEELMQALVKKYGPEPVDVPATLPAGWTQVQSTKGHVFYRHVNGTKQWTRPS
eukprot:TRINITY_DN8029_c2_g1_i1.p1 TRINITY_DN8029_c2_g1~~TRINITY_DN8029_c2_g1_i1.p1  ORF type:complete len:362 (+),score=79.88 TRINITY_DN8029_c2_g1_i1:91-1086(+)